MKLPAALGVSVTVRLAASTITTRAPVVPLTPLHRFGSWPVGYSVPAMVKRGASSSPAWQLMHARPGFITGLPLLPPVHVVPLVHRGVAPSGSGAPPDPPAPPAPPAPQVPAG